MVIIADTGPLISLIQIGRLQLLKTLYPDFIIPTQVFEELTRYQPILQFKTEVESLKQHIKVPVTIPIGSDDLDIGERACLALYYECKAEAIFIEDRLARIWVEKQGIKCFGTIALLLKAKQVGLIDQIKSSMLQMMANKRFISTELFNKALQDAGEHI